MFCWSFSVGGAVTLPSKESTAIAKSHHLLNLAKTPHNPLDSSAPLVKKGKQREVPKAKKPTSLKKVQPASVQCHPNHSSFLRVSPYPHGNQVWPNLFLFLSLSNTIGHESKEIYIGG